MLSSQNKDRTIFQKKLLLYVFSRFRQRIDNYVWIITDDFLSYEDRQFSEK